VRYVELGRLHEDLTQKFRSFVVVCLWSPGKGFKEAMLLRMRLNVPAAATLAYASTTSHEH
jgi:hypothetical protein